MKNTIYGGKDIKESLWQRFRNWLNDKKFNSVMGVGSEVYGAVVNGRKGIGVELKESYYSQAIKNLAHVDEDINNDSVSSLFNEETS